MKTLLLTIIGLSLSAYSLHSFASAVKAKPGQVSTICYYNKGDKVGQEENLEGKIKPVLIGKPCTDGAGNTGFSVIGKAEEEAEEAEEEAKAAKVQAQKNNQQVLSSICKFNKGSKTGQVENYQGKIQPLPLGTDCTDGLGSTGVIITE